MIEPVHDRADPLGEVRTLQGAMVLGIGYQAVQSVASLLACSRYVSTASVPRIFTYLALCLLQLLVYGVAVLRASNRLGQVWKPSSIAITRHVLWYAGPGMILSTWIMQAVLYGSWPATPAAWVLVGCVLLKVPHPLSLLTVVAFAQALGPAAGWNRFLSRSAKVAELYGDPDGQDWRIYWREFRARARREAKDARLRQQARLRS